MHTTKPYQRHTSVSIHLDAIVHNYQVAKQLNPNGRCYAVIKANAYGHGAVAVATALQSEADAFAVAFVEEALALRAAGISAPILVLEGAVNLAELKAADEQQLSLVIASVEQAQQWLANPPKHPMTLFIKLDTGMGRLGMDETAFIEQWAALAQHPHSQQCIAMTHMACADEPQHPLNQQQIERFTHSLEALSAAAPATSVIETSLCNSASLLSGCYQDHHSRPGIMLYGADPLYAAQPNNPHGLKASMSLHAPIIAIKTIKKGDSIGYGASHVCTQDTRMAILAIGYADGYPRHAPTGTPVYLNGQYSQTLGRVSMDMVVIDLTDIESAEIGDRVELWGQHVDVNQVAALANTISYELFCKVTTRVARNA